MSASSASDPGPGVGLTLKCSAGGPIGTSDGAPVHRLDFAGATSIEMFGLAAVTLALGGTYWLMRERDTSRGSLPAAGRNV
jgi:hypothetical protein